MSKLIFCIQDNITTSQCPTIERFTAWAAHKQLGTSKPYSVADTKLLPAETAYVALHNTMTPSYAYSLAQIMTAPHKRTHRQGAAHAPRERRGVWGDQVVAPRPAELQELVRDHCTDNSSTCVSCVWTWRQSSDFQQTRGMHRVHLSTQAEELQALRTCSNNMRPGVMVHRPTVAIAEVAGDLRDSELHQTPTSLCQCNAASCERDAVRHAALMGCDWLRGGEMRVAVHMSCLRKRCKSTRGFADCILFGRGLSPQQSARQEHTLPGSVQQGCSGPPRTLRGPVDSFSDFIASASLTLEAECEMLRLLPAQMSTPRRQSVGKT